MSAGVRVGVPSSAIPANARKVVQDLKEIVRNSDDEIYAMLKDCNMDPNETVQRLLTQDTFHEVKRKRDKKKENVNKEAGEARSRPPGVSSARVGRFVDRGTARGTHIPRYSSEASGGRGQPFNGRDSGSYQNVKASNIVTPTVSVQQQVQTKNISTGASGSIDIHTMGSSGLTGLPNGSSSYTIVAQGPRMNWSIGPGQATMADIVTSSNAQQYGTTGALLSKTSTAQPISSSNSHTYANISSMDPMLHSYLESHTMGSGNTQQDVGVLGTQRLMGEQARARSTEASSMPQSLEESPHIHQLNMAGFDVYSGRDINSVDAENPTISSSLPLEQTKSLLSVMEVGRSSEGLAISSSPVSPGHAGGRPSLPANQYEGRVAYNQHQPVGSQKGSGLEWKPKSPAKSTVTSHAVIEVSLSNEAARSFTPASPQDNTGMPTSNFDGLSIQDEQAVIIPNHLQVPEADRTHLSFGSFGEDFDAPFSTIDDKKTSASVEENTPDMKAPAEQPRASSMMSSPPVPPEQKYSTASPVAALVGSDDAAISVPVPAISPVASRTEVAKSEALVQQNTQYPYLSAIPSYPGVGVMPQLMGGQYTYEPVESQPQEVSRLPNFVSPYSDPGGNYFSPMFRPSSDVDARYTHFVSTNAANKYNTGVTLMTGQGLSSSQEAGNSIAISATGPAGQTSQTVSIAQTGLTIPQQPVPIHAYPPQHAGVPMNPFGANIFGFQYVPPSYGYMPTPYQHSYTGNTSYPQAPGSSYPPAGAGAGIKYCLPQYKAGTAPGNAPHAAVAAGYGNFPSPAGFASINPVATTTRASGYDDISGTQYKENNLYIPSQQAEGSTVWIQTQLSRDMSGIQSNSFYNMLGQGQHTGYAHTQPTHAVPAAAYASLYHQSPSGTAPTVHQLLQQPQALGAVGAVGAQSGSYQQTQRGQLSWANGY